MLSIASMPIEKPQQIQIALMSESLGVPELVANPIQPRNIIQSGSDNPTVIVAAEEAITAAASVRLLYNDENGASLELADIFAL